MPFTNHFKTCFNFTFINNYFFKYKKNIKNTLYVSEKVFLFGILKLIIYLYLSINLIQVEVCVSACRLCSEDPVANRAAKFSRKVPLCSFVP